jgi:hypothetical protein
MFRSAIERAAMKGSRAQARGLFTGTAGVPACLLRLRSPEFRRAGEDACAPSYLSKR